MIAIGKQGQNSCVEIINPKTDHSVIATINGLPERVRIFFLFCVKRDSNKRRRLASPFLRTITCSPSVAMMATSSSTETPAGPAPPPFGNHSHQQKPFRDTYEHIFIPFCAFSLNSLHRSCRFRLVPIAARCWHRAQMERHQCGMFQICQAGHYQRGPRGLVHPTWCCRGATSRLPRFTTPRM